MSQDEKMIIEWKTPPPLLDPLPSTQSPQPYEVTTHSNVVEWFVDEYVLHVVTKRHEGLVDVTETFGYPIMNLRRWRTFRRQSPLNRDEVDP